MSCDSEKTSAPDPISGEVCPVCGGGWADEKCTDNDGCEDVIELVFYAIEPHVMGDAGQLRAAAMAALRAARGSV